MKLKTAFYGGLGKSTVFTKIWFNSSGLNVMQKSFVPRETTYLQLILCKKESLAPERRARKLLRIVKQLPKIRVSSKGDQSTRSQTFVFCVRIRYDTYC